MDDAELEIQLEVYPSDDGKKITLEMTADKPITYEQFMVELEHYLHEVARAETQRSTAGADH